MVFQGNQEKELIADVSPDLFQGKTATLNSDNISAALVALENYLTTNWTTIDAAIPDPAKSTLTKQEKYELLSKVADKISVN